MKNKLFAFVLCVVLIVPTLLIGIDGVPIPTRPHSTEISG